MNYLALARKYRSVTFSEVVGQEPIATTLVNAVRTGRIAQAYLFTGTRGVGKTTMARILAKALNCLSVDAPTPEPCNECDACVAIGRGDDMDVIEIDGASNRGIDEIRELRGNAVLRPARCRYKIYYIDEVHMLTKEAFNALLKTLEEPPTHVKFVFATTEAEKIPATILSRCQRFDFRNISTDEIAGHLQTICKREGIEISADAVFRVAKAAAGSMRDGISLLDQLISSAVGALTEEDVLRVLGEPPEERIAALLRDIADGEPAAALQRLDDILAGGFPLEGVAAALADQFRNVMLALTCGADSKLVELSESGRQSLAAAAQRFSLPAAVHAVSVCEQLMRNLRGSSCARALAEAAVVRLAAADKFVDPASLISRLEQLAAGGGRTAGSGARPPRPMPGATEAKKKAIAVPARSATPGEVGRNRAATVPAERQTNRPRNTADADEPVAWDTAWLAARWDDLMKRLAAMGYPEVAGALGPARVIGIDGDALRLTYDAEHEPVCRRVTGAFSGRVGEALCALLGRKVRVQAVAVKGDKPTVRSRLSGKVNTEQWNQVAGDPAVRAVQDLFGGKLTDVQYDKEYLGLVADGDGPEPADVAAIDADPDAEADELEGA